LKVEFASATFSSENNDDNEGEEEEQPTTDVTTDGEEDSEETFEEAIWLATYSNSEPTVFAYSSIFENLWIRAIVPHA
jgi:hypothetical protein